MKGSRLTNVDLVLCELKLNHFCSECTEKALSMCFLLCQSVSFQIYTGCLLHSSWFSYQEHFGGATPTDCAECMSGGSPPLPRMLFQVKQVACPLLEPRLEHYQLTLQPRGGLVDIHYEWPTTPEMLVETANSLPILYAT